MVAAPERPLLDRLAARLGEEGFAPRPRYSTNEILRSFSGGRHCDVERAVDGILDAFARHGRAFLTRFSSLEEVLAMCARDDDATSVLTLAPHVRAQVAVAAAFVLGDQARFRALLPAKVAFLEASGRAADVPRLRAFWEKLAARLSSR